MDAEAAHRARSLAEMAKIQGRMMKPEDFMASISDYKPRPTDVIISPFGKCGTTWLQQTFHTLRTGGDMDFDDISRVVPWIETARTLTLDINAEQRAQPRGFKSHLGYDAMPKGAKYVVSLRNPKDALVSMHRFMEGWFLEPDAVSVAEFAQGWLTSQPGRPNYWSHLVSWWEQRDNPDVLLLSYEHMTAEPEANVRRLAAFCGLPLSDELLRLTLANSSIGFMLEHKDRFDDAMMRRVSEEKCGLPPGSDSSKVAKGGVGGHKALLPPEIDAAVDAAWAEHVAPKTGFADYWALEAALRG